MMQLYIFLIILSVSILTIYPEKISDNNKNNKFLRHLENEDKYSRFISKLKSNSFKKIIFMTGAGASTSAGIPDFRSDEGLFKQLQVKYNLSRPEEFFDIHRFFRNPEYFYDYYRDFRKGNYTPTPFHYFMGFLDQKKLLKYVFTQNIDGLDLKCGIDEEKLIFAHGNFIDAHCPSCGMDIDRKLFDEYVDRGEILRCPKCHGPVKSNVVFYGENLPMKFFEKSSEVEQADLTVICGTSLLVSPFNLLPTLVNKDCFMLFINKEKINRGFAFDDENSHDLFIEDTCDNAIFKIVKDVGWENEFNQYIEKFKK